MSKNPFITVGEPVRDETGTWWHYTIEFCGKLLTYKRGFYKNGWDMPETLVSITEASRKPKESHDE